MLKRSDVMNNKKALLSNNEFIMIYYFFIPVVSNTIANIFLIFGKHDIIISSGFSMLKYILIIPVLAGAIKRMHSFPIILFLVYIILLIFSFLYNPLLFEMGIGISHIWKFFTDTIIPIILFCYCESFEKLRKSFKLFLFLGIICALSQWAYWFLCDEKQYSMGFSYSVMPMLIYGLYITVTEYKITYAVYTLFLLCTCAVCGSRASLLCCIIFMFIYTLVEKNTKVALVFKMIFISAMMLAYVFSKYIFDWLYSLFPDSRTFKTFSEGGFSYTAGRDVIWGEQMKAVLENPLAFRGLYADRVVSFLSQGIRNRYPNETSFLGLYAHNIFIEILVQFGIVFGGILIFIMVYCLVKSILLVRHSQDQACRIWYIVIITCAVTGLLVSGSYLQDIKFGMTCGIICKLFSMEKDNKGKLKSEVIS